MLRILAKIFFAILLVAGFLCLYYFGYPFPKHDHVPSLKDRDIEIAEYKKLQDFGSKAKLFCKQHDSNLTTCFLVDMSLPSGTNRLFVYNMNKDSVMNYGLVAHGSCNTSFLAEPKFSNEPGCGCSSVGKYKISGK